jgi:hypothetical protein
MHESGEPSIDFETPTIHQVLAAGLWLALAVGACMTDWARTHRSDADRHPNDLRYRASMRADVAPVASPVAVPTSTLSPNEIEREKKRQDLMNESILAYDGPSDGPFAGIIGLVPCWLFFIVCAVLMLLGEVQRAYGYGLGAWTFWAWGCQFVLCDPPRWT